MIDFAPVREGKLKVKELVERDGLGYADLAPLTNEMIDRMLDLIGDCTDADVTFVPSDPGAVDHAAATDAEVNLAWTLGHVIVHTTASAEESAFLAAELARGVKWHGRSRYEVPWETVTTIRECRERLQESRRMRLATLEVWTRPPQYDNTYSPVEGVTHNCVSRFVGGLSHDDSHLGQIEEIVRQAREARARA